MMQTMRKMTLSNIARTCGGTLCGADEHAAEREITCAEIDSRKILPGGLFFATVGNRVDGHSFIGQVFEAGAACVVTEKSPAQVEEEFGTPAVSWGAYILVESSFAALKKIAAYYRALLPIPVVGVTGSVGKTSTKEYIAGVLSEKYNVLKTEGNYNNEIGLPLTLLRIRQEHEAAVLEMGISEFGEMSRLGEMAKPDICVITNIGQCHLENLHSRAGVFKAKTEIFDYLNEDGEICLNGEDDMLVKVEHVHGKKVHHFGISDGEGFEVYAADIEDLGLMGSRAVMHFAGEQETYPVEITLPGRHMVLNAMAAAQVGRLLFLTPGQIREGIRKVEPVGGRCRIFQTEKLTVIDDCYNANPVSVKAAIDLLAATRERKTAILGDMFELGEDENAMHAEIGAYAVEQGIDAVFCVGEKSKYMYDAALEGYDGAQDIRYFETLDELLESLDELLLPGDTVLVKASHGMKFDRIIERLEKRV